MNLNTCEDKHNLPSLGFIFKGYTKDGKDEAFELILTPDDYVLEFEVDGKSDCVVGIGSDNEDSGWTLGQVFLRAYYTVFDRESEAIGFVKSNLEPNLEEMENKNIQTISNHNLAKIAPLPEIKIGYGNQNVFKMTNQISLMNGPIDLLQTSSFNSFLK